MGAKNNKMIGSIVQTAFFVGTIASIPVALLWWFGSNKKIKK
jgi:Na+-driven multidrug efflux pump